MISPVEWDNDWSRYVKSEGTVKQKLKQVRTRHLHKLLESSLRKRPHNCIFNEHRQGTDGAEIQVCLKDLTVCDARFDGVERAKACPIFSPNKDKDTLKDEYRDFLDTASRAEIAFRYPDMAPLIWVLDESFDEPLEDEAALDLIDPKDQKVPWWDFLFRWFRR